MKLMATGNSVVSVTGMIIKFHLVTCVGGYSSVVEHSTADREVTGSIPVAPFNLIFITLFNLRKTRDSGKYFVNQGLRASHLEYRLFEHPFGITDLCLSNSLVAFRHNSQLLIIFIQCNIINFLFIREWSGDIVKNLKQTVTQKISSPSSSRSSFASPTPPDPGFPDTPSKSMLNIICQSSI